VVEVLYAVHDNTSTDFLMILSTNYDTVEVVEMVEVLSVLKEEETPSGPTYHLKVKS
jgi:hypothetical protein